jgi:hypothetical protein
MHGGGHGFGHGGHWGHGYGHRHHRFGHGFYVGGSCWRTVWSDFGPRRVYACNRYL